MNCVWQSKPSSSAPRSAAPLSSVHAHTRRSRRKSCITADTAHVNVSGHRNCADVEKPHTLLRTNPCTIFLDTSDMFILPISSLKQRSRATESADSKRRTDDFPHCSPKMATAECPNASLHPVRHTHERIAATEKKYLNFVEGSPLVFDVQLVHQDLQVVISDLADTTHHVSKPHPGMPKNPHWVTGQ